MMQPADPLAQSFEQYERKYLLTSFCGLVVLLFIRFFFDHSSYEIPSNVFLLLHTILESFSIFVAFSIFMQARMTYAANLTSNYFFIGIVFLAVGSFDFFHTLFYKDMPFFDDIHTVSRATWFWILARLVESVGVFISLIITYQFPIKRRIRTIGYTIVVIALFSFVVIAMPEKLPVLIEPETGMKSLKIGMEYVICLFMLLSIGILAIRYRRVRDINTLRLMAAIFFILLGEVYFTFYLYVFDLENLLGHVFKALGYMYLYRAVFFPYIESIVENQRNTEIKRKEAEQLLLKFKKELPHLVLQAHEEERKRVSRELHDGIGQSLYSILMTLSAAEQQRVEEERYKILAQAKKMTVDAMTEVKGIAHSLRPSALDDLGFMPALKSLIEQYESIHKIQIKLKYTGDSSRLPAKVETELYRICQETLSNSAKYAQTKTIELAIVKTVQHVRLTIRDFGKGFSLDQYSKNTSRKGIGLFSMNERAEALNGTFDIHSAPGEGTTISVCVPISE